MFPQHQLQYQQVILFFCNINFNINRPLKFLQYQLQFQQLKNISSISTSTSIAKKSVFNMEFNINSSKLFWQYQLQFQQFNKKSAISILLLIVKFVILNINFNINMVFSQLQLQCRYQYFRNYSCNINSDTIPIVLQQFQQFFQQPFQYGTIVHPWLGPSKADPITKIRPHFTIKLFEDRE